LEEKKRTKERKQKECKTMAVIKVTMKNV